MKLKHLIFPVLLSVFAGGFTHLSASTVNHASEKPTRQIEFLKSKLELNDEQTEAIKSISKNSYQQASADAQALKKVRKQIRNLMKSKQLNDSKLRQLARKAADLHANIMIIRHQSRQLIAAQLTDEQNAKFDMFSELRNDMRKKRRKR